jgi:hypothetical protein
LNSIESEIPVARPEAKPKKETKANSVADAKHNGVRDGAGKQPQWAVLSAQQVVGKIETTYHIETSTRNADGRDCVVVHSKIADANTPAAALPKRLRLHPP